MEQMQAPRLIDSDRLEHLCCGLHEVIYRATEKADRVTQARADAMGRRIMNEWNKRLKVLDLALKSRFTSTSKLMTEADGRFADKTADKLFNEFVKNKKGLTEKIRKDVQFIYNTNKTAFVKKHGLTPIEKQEAEIVPAFTEVDAAVVSALGEQQAVASNVFYRRNLSSEVTQIVEETFKEGLNQKNAGEALRRRLGKKLGLSKEAVDTKLVPEGYTGSGESYFKGLSQTTLNRGRSFSDIRALEDAGFEKYRITNPSPVAAICKQMAGRIFTVASGVKQMNSVLEQKDPDGIKSVAPWQRDLSSFGIKGREKLTNAKTNASLADAGLALPPYHFKCNTVIDPV